MYACMRSIFMVNMWFTEPVYVPWALHGLFLVVDELREMLRSLLSDQMDKEAIEFDRLGIALRLVRFDLYHLLL